MRQFVQRFESLAADAEALGVGLAGLPARPGPEPVLLVAGSIKAGKSSLVNDLVGERLLPDDRPVTDSRVYARVTASCEEEAVLVYASGERVPTDLEDARKLLSKLGGEDGRLRMLDRVELGTTSRFLDGFALEDSPGMDDACTGRSFVRDDMLDRASRSSAVLYLIAGRALPSASDASRLKWLTEHGVPWLVAMSRWDEVDEDELVEEDEDPRAARIRSLNEWGIPVRVEAVHFVSSLGHRNGEDGGVEPLGDALSTVMRRRDVLHEARFSRWVADVSDDLACRIESWIAESLAVDHASEEREGMRRARRIAGCARRMSSAVADLRMRCTRTVQALIGDVRAECARVEPDGSLEQLWQEAWEPQVLASWQDAIEVFDRELGAVGDLAGETPQALDSPTSPRVVFVPFDNFADVELLADIADKVAAGDAVKKVLARLGKDAMARLRREAWTSLMCKRVEEGCRLAIDPILAAAERRVDLLCAALEDTVEAAREDAAGGLALRATRASRTVTALRNLGQEARRWARSQAKA